MEHEVVCAPAGGELKLKTAEAKFTSTEKVKLVNGAAWHVAGAVNWLVSGKFLKAGEEKKARTSGGEIWRWKNAKGEDVEVVCKFTDDETITGIGLDDRTYLTYKCEMIKPIICDLGNIIVPKEPTDLKSRGGKYYDLGEGIKVSMPAEGSECVLLSNEEITGKLEGEWSNAATEVLYPETALEGSTLKTAGAEKVVVSGNDKVELEEVGTLEVGGE